MGNARDIREPVEEELRKDPAEAARRAAGVASVHNHLEVALPPGDYQHAAAESAVAGLTSVRNISNKIDYVFDSVTLIGHVRTEAQRAAVVEVVWREHAVMAVIDQLEITG